MKFDNSLFDNIPIEFKEINPEDFDETIYNVQTKEIINPDDEGYLSKSLLPILESDLKNKNTTVINAGVGQGKTTAIIDIMNKCVNDYIVIIAVPYKNLINQYVEECSKDISKYKIFSLLEFDNFFKKKEGKKKSFGYVDDEQVIKESMLKSIDVSYFDIHILTVNSLLGNAGNSLFQKSQKAFYLQNLKNYSRKSGKKIIVLFDEIHDAIHNFEERFIYKFWGFQDLIHKTYIISATFNEASKEVVKYLSEFTDYNIKILESKRNRDLERQSELHLNFYKNRHVYNDNELFKLLKGFISEKESFDVLAYSKNQSKRIIKRLKDCGLLKEEEVNRCYSDAFDRKNANKVYSKNKINIGTNFSTGISINKENHNFVILLPQDINIEYLNNNGIFTNGYNVIIQSLARQRKKGNIYVFLPKPIGVNSSTFPYTLKQKQKLDDVFSDLKSDKDEEADYHNINEDNIKLDNVYKSLIKSVSDAKNKISKFDRGTKFNRLQYPTKDIFILKYAESYLVNTSFNGNFSAYFLWAALCNQFLNCKLETINTNFIIELNKETIYSDIIYKIEREKKTMSELWDGFISDEDDELENSNIVNYGKENYSLVNSFSKYELLQLFKDYFFNKTVIKIIDKEGKRTTYNEQKDKKILLMIMCYVVFDSKKFNTRNDKKNLGYYYLKSCVIYSYQLEEAQMDSFTLSEINCFKIYKKWYRLFLILETLIKQSINENRLATEPKSEVLTLFAEINLEQDLQTILNEDEYFSNKVFTLKDTIRKSKNIYESFYTFFIHSFYELERTKTTKDGISKPYYLVEAKKNIDIKNLLYKDLPEETL